MSQPNPIQTLHEFRASLVPSLIAVKGHLDRPYPDDARWTPWSRFIERELVKLDHEYLDALAAVTELAEAAREFDAWIDAQGYTQASVAVSKFRAALVLFPPANKEQT